MISNQAFDLVLLDIQMPGIDGSEVLRLFKGSQETAQLPAIMISGLEDIDVVVECVKLVLMIICPSLVILLYCGQEFALLLKRSSGTMKI